MARPFATAWRISIAAYAVIVAIAALPAWLLLASGETLSGRLAGLIPVAIATIPPIVAISRRRKLPWLPAVPAAVALTSGIAMLALTPDGRPSDSHVRSVFLDGEFDRWSIANIVPEIDQLELGSYLVAPVDPVIDLEQAARLRALVLAQYRPMEDDPAFRTLGSVMGAAYQDRDLGHLYVYEPDHAPSERRPVLLFLHGSAGNFKAYFHLWYPLAKKLRWVLVCPSFGFGNWNQPGGMEAIDRAYQYSVESLGGDPDRVYLVALSNGGRGATRTFAAHPERYAAVVMVSAVLEQGPIASVRGGYQQRPVLVLHGARDRRIPIVWTRSGIERLHEQGAVVTERAWPDEDHFLLFAQGNAIRNVVAEWIAEQSSGTR